MDFKSNDELIDFLSTDIKGKDAIDEIFKIIIDYLSTFKDLNFEYEIVIPFNGIMNKYINCARYLGADTKDLKLSIEKFLNFANDYSRYKRDSDYTPILFRLIKPFEYKKRVVRLRDEEKKSKENIFHEIYNQVVLVYNSIKDFSKEKVEIELDGFYNPNVSNKDSAKKLINDAIDLINNDDSLSEKAKKSIVEYLNKALTEFDKPNSNWSLIFGKIRETIFVLGALGSLAGGFSGTIALNQAKQKLEEATEIIEKSSINVNYANVKQLFNIENTVYIENNQPKLLVEKNTKDEKTAENTQYKKLGK